MCFNPRAHVGRDLRVIRVIRWQKFQSTRPRGARLCDPCQDRSVLRVSIHAPTWGATARNTSLSTIGVFQSTRPRGARPLLLPLATLDIPVSIHAPTWGATLLLPLATLDIPVSIHAPTWGATSAWRSLGFVPSGFNPRAHVGRDHCTLYKPFPDVFQSTRPRGARRRYAEGYIRASVSIHAPTWGATRIRA